MKFPQKYIKKGKFKLHGGEITDTFYDVNFMLTDKKQSIKIIEFVIGHKIFDTYVGIATGGAIIASHCGTLFMNSNWAMIKDGELKGELKESYCLVDDVVTTESSLKTAMSLICKKPSAIFVVVDRRKKKTLDITSMYDV